MWGAMQVICAFCCVRSGALPLHETQALQTKSRGDAYKWSILVSCAQWTVQRCCRARSAMSFQPTANSLGKCSWLSWCLERPVRITCACRSLGLGRTLAPSWHLNSHVSFFKPFLVNVGGSRKKCTAAVLTAETEPSQERRSVNLAEMKLFERFSLLLI